MKKIKFIPSEFICSKDSFLAAEKIVREDIDISLSEQVYKVVQGIKYFCRELWIDETSDDLLKTIYHKLKVSDNFEYKWVAEKVNKIVWFENKIETVWEIASFLRENFDKILDKWAEKEEIIEIFEKKDIDKEVFKKYFWNEIINYFIAYI